jgi:hypothetical protein
MSAAATSASQGQSMGQGQGQASGSGSGDGQVRGEAGRPVAGAAAAGLDRAAWSALPERLRQAVRSGAVEQFGEEHQQAIRAYFTRLSEER